MPLEDWRTGPLYSIREAARLAGVSPATVKRWIQGYQTVGGQRAPVFGDPIETPLVSFLQLAEIITASGFRRKSVTLERVRAAHRVAQREMGIEYPFATLNLEAFTGHILHITEPNNPWVAVAVLDTPGKYTLPGLVRQVLRTFDYE